jgi:hypothetical protein
MLIVLAAALAVVVCPAVWSRKKFRGGMRPWLFSIAYFVTVDGLWQVTGYPNLWVRARSTINPLDANSGRDS